MARGKCHPVHKKGSKIDRRNYRPISLTSVICIILEKIIKADILSYLIRNQLITKAQFGFVPNKFCTTNLLESLDTITKTLSDKNVMDIVFLDFAKAFDKVKHQYLIIKLANYGIEGNLLDWIKSFLKTAGKE